MKVTLTNAEIVAAVTDYLCRKGLVLKSMTVRAPPWGEPSIDAETSSASSTVYVPIMRPRSDTLAGASADDAGRCAYDLATRLLSSTTLVSPWSQLDPTEKARWLAEADFISAARRGNDR